MLSSEVEQVSIPVIQHCMHTEGGIAILPGSCRSLSLYLSAKKSPFAFAALMVETGRNLFASLVIEGLHLCINYWYKGILAL